MQKFLVTTLPESHGISAEVEIILAACTIRPFPILQTHPSFFVVPSLANRVLVLHGVQIDLVALAALLGQIHCAAHHLLCNQLFTPVPDLFGH